MRRIPIKILLVIAALLLPVFGYCNPFSDLIKNQKAIAVKVAEFHENKEVGFWRYEIWGLDFSPDGKYLAATSPTTLEVQIWDWQNKRIVRTLEKAQGGDDLQTTESIRYSPDGHLLVACHSRAADYIVARIWNTGTWETVHDITDPVGGGGCNAIGFTPDGKSLIRVLDRIVTKPGDNLIIYDTTSWQPVWGLRTVPFYPKALAISSDGMFVAIGGVVNNPRSWTFNTPLPAFGDPPLADQSLIAIVDMEHRKIIRTMQNTVNFDLGHLGWSPDGVLITATGRRDSDYSISLGKEFFTSGPDTVMVFDAHTGKQVAGEQIENVEGTSLRYTPEGKYLIEGFMIGKGSGEVRIWDSQHRELMQTIPGEVGSLAVSRDGHYFAMSIDNKISVWQLK